MQAELGLPAAALKLARVLVQVSVLGSAQVQEPVQAELPAEALALPEGRSAEELAGQPPAESSAAAG